jgi:hypothetical protein
LHRKRSRGRAADDDLASHRGEALAAHELLVATWGTDCAGAIAPDWKSSFEPR